MFCTPKATLIFELIFALFAQLFRHTLSLKNIRLLTILLFATKLISAQNLFDSLHTQQYANYLQTTKQYNLAASEYNRLLFFNTTNSNAFLGYCYNLRKAGNAAMVVSNYENTLLQKFKIDTTIFSEYIKALIQLNNAKKAITAIEQNNNLLPNNKLLLSSFVNVSIYNWKQANANLNSLTTKTETTQKVQTVLADALKYKYKKPVVAAALSAIIPGLGKVYTGNFKDGIISFIFVGINTFQSIRYYNKKGFKSGGTWIFGGLAAGFYLGNIYGSFKAAKLKNKQINNGFKNKIQEITDMD